MEKFVEDVARFLDDDDVRILRTLSNDAVILHSIKKIFENPDKVSKYLILLRDSPVSVYIVAKIAERLSRFLEGDDESKCFGIFLTSLRELRKCNDRKILQNMFTLLKEAIDRRIADEKYEDAARLVVEFQDFGFKGYIRKILFFALEVSESGDFARAISILSHLPNSEAVTEAKASVMLEWGKALAKANPEAGLRKIEESLKFKDTLEARIAMAEVYEAMGSYEKAYEIYSSLKGYPGIDRRISRMLMEWGEETGDVEKLKEAYVLASGDRLLAEEIERRIRKIEAHKLSGS